jgi:hypothetical protein
VLDKDRGTIHNRWGIRWTSYRIMVKGGDRQGITILIHFCTALMTNKILFKKKGFYNRYQVDTVDKWEKPADQKRERGAGRAAKIRESGL